jgi:hypothetical protein
MTPRQIEQERARIPCTRAEARRRIARRERQGYAELAAARWPGHTFATLTIAASVGLIEAIGRPEPRP